MQNSQCTLPYKCVVSHTRVSCYIKQNKMLLVVGYSVKNGSGK